MEEKRFWKMIEKMDWAGEGRDRSIEANKRMVFETLTVVEFKQFQKMYYQKKDELARAVDKYVEENWLDWWSGDDGFSDTIAHVVGLGQRVYESSLKDPLLVHTRGKAGEYAESFSYCIPYDDDVSMLDPDFHLKRIEKHVGEYFRPNLIDGRDQSEMMSIDLVDDKLAYQALESLMKKIDSLPYRIDDVVATLEEIVKEYAEIEDSKGYRWVGDVLNGYSVPNVINDYRKWFPNRALARSEG